MHECNEFRERISEQIIDRIDLDKDVETRRELMLCSSCADFYAESREALELLSGVEFEIPELQWNAMAERMSARIHEDYAARQVPTWRRWFYIPALAGAVACLLIVVVFDRSTNSIPPEGTMTRSAGMLPAPAPLNADFTGDPSVDPVTIEFLEESELLLRSVMKLKPTSVEDLEDAQRIAGRHLVALDQRKEAVAEVQPLVKAMDKYETVLRDIRNLDRRSQADDITDIKNRIEKNGLISNLAAFQPRPAMAEISPGFEK